MKTPRSNRRYVREKSLARRMGLQPIPGSGNRWELGRDDAEDMYRLMQAKSTIRNAGSLRFLDLYQLQQHAQTKIPTFVLDFESPSVTQGSGIFHLPESVWVAVPLDHYMVMYQAWLDKYHPGENVLENFLEGGDTMQGI